MNVNTRQLLAYSFPPGSDFQGQLVGALERIESGGAMRILDALFVGRAADTGELVAVSLSSDSAAGMIGKLLSFRLDDSARRRATERALEEPTGGVVRSVQATLEPGGAVAAVLVEHAWAVTLGETVNRLGGTQMVGEFVDAGQVAEVWPQIARPEP